ncbi:unnamed protein product [marine sediment metagenome]|uniref:Uncharacterized protein n=1 Tax=marine sediment metagenome TaxID=412755 RepID=X1FDI6_9ZZZZ
MEFADGQCYQCGKEFSNRKPKTVTKVDKPYSVPPTGRLAEFVSPCPFCGQNVPLWGGSQIAPEPAPEPEPEAKAPEPEAEPVAAPEPEASEPED